MRKVYPSDITVEQFEKIKPFLLGMRKTTRPRVIDLFDVFCAVLYLLKVDANGECCLVIFQNGKMCMPIFEYGA